MIHFREQLRKTVVVHRGARDGYQVARALSEAGLLKSLVTDVYWPGDKRWARGLEAAAPKALRSMLAARYSPGLPSSEVRWTKPSGPLSFALDKLSGISFEQRRRAQRWTDAALGNAAGTLAAQTGSQLLSYSYYGYHAFKSFGKPGMLFQVHPHPVSVRRLLTQEFEQNPECAESLKKEWELSLPAEDFARLTAETTMAAHFLCASSFTRQTLVENGIPAERIQVIPYGVDATRFSPRPSESVAAFPRKEFRLLFVGTINQRKGIKYLLEALRLTRSKQVKLVVCGRVVDDLKLFSSFGSQVEVRPSVTFEELQGAYQEADLFVFPSIVEGFAQVLLEALSSGLPILSTTHTAAPDLIEEGIQGYVVPPRRPDLLAERIDWLATHRNHVAEMKVAARKRAEAFDWARFRGGIVESVSAFARQSESLVQPVVPYV